MMGKYRDVVDSNGVIDMAVAFALTATSLFAFACGIALEPTRCPVQSTSCPANTTCCKAVYSSSGYGCCMHSDAVCCEDQKSCCPSGYNCTTLSTGVACISKARSAKPEDLNFPCGQFQGQDCKCATLCMPGPEYNASTSKPNCLILGDSVSIGYTPHVISMLNDSCFVQHSPWSSDGGACSTSYALSCIDVFTSTAQLYPIKPNVYLFNFGLHDYNLNSEAFFDEYVSELTKIRDRLLQSGARLLWATTTPVPYSSEINDVVNILNGRALSEVMNPAHIPKVDLYQAVIDRCGLPPYWNCSISLNRPGSPNVHYNSDGYQYLASLISPAIKNLLKTA